MTTPVEGFHRHSNGGGLVADTATVDVTAYVGPAATVLDNAQVKDLADICGNAIVKNNAKVMHHALVRDNAVICGSAVVSDRARVVDSAIIEDRARVYNAAKVSEHACISGEATVNANARVWGHAIVRGKAHVYGTASIGQEAIIQQHARVFRNAHVYGAALIGGFSVIQGDAVVYGNARIDGDTIDIGHHYGDNKDARGPQHYAASQSTDDNVSDTTGDEMSNCDKDVNGGKNDVLDTLAGVFNSSTSRMREGATLAAAGEAAELLVRTFHNTLGKVRPGWVAAIPEGATSQRAQAVLLAYAVKLACTVFPSIPAARSAARISDHVLVYESARLFQPLMHIATQFIDELVKGGGVLLVNADGDK